MRERSKNAMVAPNLIVCRLTYRLKAKKGTKTNENTKHSTVMITNAINTDKDVFPFDRFADVFKNNVTKIIETINPPQSNIGCPVRNKKGYINPMTSRVFKRRGKILGFDRTISTDINTITRIERYRKILCFTIKTPDS